MKLKDIPILQLVIVSLLVVILLQRCGGNSKENGTQQPDTVRTIVKTVIVIHDSAKGIPQKTSTVKISTSSRDSIFYIDTTREHLLKLIETHYADHIYTDRYNFDSGRGFVQVDDTISQNGIKGRGYRSQLNLPVTTITNTITLPSKQVRQVYLGGGIQINQTDLINGVKVGLLYKDKQDRIFKAGVGTSFKLVPFVDLETYWKINLRKR